MSTSCDMIGSAAAWACGYTGAGSRIAVIDTGIDTNHQSFSDEAFAYSLSKRAELTGQDPDAYVESLHLLDAEEITSPGRGAERTGPVPDGGPLYQFQDSLWL